MAVAQEILRFDLPAGPANVALREYAQQSGRQVLLPRRQLQDYRANAVNGRYTPDEALELLLADTGLEAVVKDTGMLVVKIADKAEQKAGEAMKQQKKGLLAQIIDLFSKPAAVVAVATGVTSGVSAQESAQEQGQRSGMLEEVVVTAQKRGAQVLQDVPISINVMRGEQLDASTYQGVNDAIAGMPGVSLYDSAQSGGSRISIRGVAPASSIVSTSATTAYYLDNMPFGFSRISLAPDANPYDLERVEVLKGPQGTLYGASSLGGVVRILTHDANLDEFGLKGRADFSGTEGGGVNYRGDMAVNVPIVPGKLAIRGVIGYQNNDGWIDSPVADDINDAEIQTYRIKIGAQPIENLRIDFTGWFSRDDRDSVNIGLEDNFTPNDVNQPVKTDYDLYGLSLEYDINDSISIVSTSTYMEFDNIGTLQIVPGLPLDFDLGGGALNFITTAIPNEAFTQEILVNSNTDGPWSWSVGGFYRYNEDFSERSGVIGVFSDVSTSEQTAVFGELTRGFFDGKADLTVGLRYFNDDLKLKSVTSDVILGPGKTLLRDVGTDGFDRVDTDSFDELTHRVVLTGYPNDNLTVYASYSRGFRSGFIQRAVALELDPNLPNVEPDVLDNFELGAKGTIADGRVSFDVALFYLDWEDVQQSLRLLPPGGQDVPFTTSANVGNASGPGVDAGFDVTVTDNLTIHGSVGWNDLTFDQDILSASEVQFEKGSRLDESPEWTASARVEYWFPIGGSGYEGLLSGSMNFTDPLTIRDSMGDFVPRADSILISNINLTVTPPSKKLSFALYVDNLNDEDGIVAIQDAIRPNLDSRLRPRTYGLRASYQY